MTEPSEFVALIDESGCAGDAFSKGSSQYLVMATVVVRRCNLEQALNIFSLGKTERDRKKPFKKFSKSSDKDNFVLTKLLGQAPVRIVCIGSHKPSLSGTYIRKNHAQEYNYLLKMIAERASWVTRDAPKRDGQTNSRCQLSLSEMRMYSYDDMASYLRYLRSGDGRFNTRAEWECLDESIHVAPHVDEAEHHLADLAASAFARAVEPKEHGMTDDRFIRNLSPRLYRQNGKIHGIKLFPAQAIEQLKSSGQLQFLNLL